MPTNDREMPNEIWCIYAEKNVRGEHEIGYWDTIDDGDGAKYIRSDLAPAAQGDVAEAIAYWEPRLMEIMEGRGYIRTLIAAAKPHPAQNKCADVCGETDAFGSPLCCKSKSSTAPVQSQEVGEVNYDADMWERELIKFVGTLSYTVWNICHNPTHADGNSDWFNDTLPHVVKGQEIIKGHIEKIRAATQNQPSPDELTIDDYKEAFKDHQRLVRELDVALNGEEGAAKQASLCDIVHQVKALNQPAGSAEGDRAKALEDLIKEALSMRDFIIDNNFSDETSDGIIAADKAIIAAEQALTTGAKK